MHHGTSDWILNNRCGGVEPRPGWSRAAPRCWWGPAPRPPPRPPGPAPGSSCQPAQPPERWTFGGQNIFFVESILLEIWSFHQLLFHVNYNSWIQLDISSWYANMCLCMFDISILSHGHGWVYCRRYFWFWFESDGMSWCRLPAVWQSGSLGGVASQEGGRPRSRPGPTTTTTTTARIMSGYFVHAATRVPSHKTAVSVCFYSHSQRIFEQLLIINVIKVLALL